MNRVVVVGAGLAGHELVRRLLADPSFDGEITWYGAEPDRPYNRVLLTDVLAGRYARDAIVLPTLADPRLTWKPGHHFRAISAIPFDRLVLATGADPVIPPVRGNALPLRTLGDVRTIISALDSGVRRIAVAGGGSLGVETACALSRRGVHVELVHRGPHLLNRWLDRDAGDLLASSVRAVGIAVRCGVEVSAADGEWPRADLVITACGVTPRTALANAAKLPIDRGILVDAVGHSLGDPRVFAIGDCAQPSDGGRGLGDPRVFAIGDCAQPSDGGRSLSDPRVFAIGEGHGLALTALEQARRAADAILGRESAPITQTPVLRLRSHGVPGLEAAVLGRPRAEPTIHITDQHRRTRKALTLDADSRLTAACLVGDVTAAADLAGVIAKARPQPASPAALLTSAPR